MVVLYRIGIAKKQFNYFFACVPRYSTETHIKYPCWRHGIYIAGYIAVVVSSKGMTLPASPNIRLCRSTVLLFFTIIYRGGEVSKLTEKQKKFVDEYLIDLNATQAAIRAGYSEKTARSIGQRLLTNVDIQKYMQKEQKELQERTSIRQEDVLRELATIGFAKITDFVGIYNGYVIPKDTADIPKDKIGAVASIEAGKDGVKIRLNSKLDALEKIGRHLGMFDSNRAQETAENNLIEKIKDSVQLMEGIDEDEVCGV